MTGRRTPVVPLGGAVLCALLCLPAPDARAAGWYPLFGFSWARPLDSGVNSLYGSGPTLHAGLGYRISARLRTEVSLGWHRGTGEPSGGLAKAAEGTFTALPFWIELRVVPWRHGMGGSALSPWVAAGPAVVFSREELRYRLFEEVTRLRGRRSDVGGTAAAGVEFRWRGWQASICGRAVLTGGHREVLRPGGRVDERARTATPSLGSAGLEVRVPLP